MVFQQGEEKKKADISCPEVVGKTQHTETILYLIQIVCAIICQKGRKRLLNCFIFLWSYIISLLAVLQWRFTALLNKYIFPYCFQAFRPLRSLIQAIPRELTLFSIWVCFYSLCSWSSVEKNIVMLWVFCRGLFICFSESAHFASKHSVAKISRPYLVYV